MSVIDRLYTDSRDLLHYLQENGEISFQNNVDDNFRRTLLLSAASYFEAAIKESMIKCFEVESNGSEIVLRFLEKKAMERKYHEFFSWKESNANAFWALFGDGFSNFMKSQVNGDTALKESIRAFLKIGNSRNELVHQNFATFPLEMTADEIYQLYKTALFFVEIFPVKLREYIELTRPPVPE